MSLDAALNALAEFYFSRPALAFNPLFFLPRNFSPNRTRLSGVFVKLARQQSARIYIAEIVICFREFL
jgi:hypothetical protein